MPSCDGSQAGHRAPARHRRPSRFRCSPDCSTPLRLAAHVGLQPRTRKSHRFRWEGFARATPETGPAPGVPTTIRSNKLPAALLRPSEERRAVRARAFRRVAVTTTEPPFRSEPRRRPRTCHRSTSFRPCRWPRAVHGFPSRCSVSSRRGVSSATDCSGYRSPLLACQLGRPMRSASRSSASTAGALSS